VFQIVTMRTITIAVLTAAVLLPAGSASAASCGELNGGFENTIRTEGVGCTDARDIVRRWHRKAVGRGEGPGTKYVGTFYCVSRATGPAHVRVSCADRKRKIRFNAGP
jgi:hypothetical protein